MVIYPVARERAAILVAPYLKDPSNYSGVILATELSKIYPSEYTECKFIPYMKGFKFNLAKKAASEFPTTLPYSITLTSFKISI